ncbi:MAG: hypothetical protein KBF88_08520 [Polyangiaceae bacterium]|nr:hypothetical protein [Polyangiaceae bacterium]
MKVLEVSRFTKSWPFTTAIMTLLLWFAQSLHSGSTPLSNLAAVIVLILWAAYAHWLATQRVTEATVEVFPASIRLRGKGLEKTLRPRDIRSSTTALNGDGGYEISLELRGYRDPIVLQGLGDGEFGSVKEALGLLQTGEGTLLWRSGKRLAQASWVFAIVLSFLFWKERAQVGDPPGSVLILLPWILVGLIIATSVKRKSLRMHAQGVEICDAKGIYRTVRWDEIQTVTRYGDDLSFRVVGTLVSIQLGLSVPILEAILAQLNAALVRSRANVPPANEIDILVSLRRSKDESVSEWIARIDSLEVGDNSYRRAAALPLETLRSAVDDPDLDPEIRGAAARILLRIDASHRERIEIALSRVHAEDKREELVLLSHGDASTIERHEKRVRARTRH